MTLACTYLHPLPVVSVQCFYIFGDITYIHLLLCIPRLIVARFIAYWANTAPFIMSSVHIIYNT